MSAVPLRLAQLPAEVLPASRGLHRTPERAGSSTGRASPGRLVTSTAPVALLVAPAGYGKSALLAQWEARDERPFAWAPLPARPAAGTGAIAAIGAALHGIGALDHVGATSGLALAEAWTAARVPHVLVLDGADVLDDDAGADLLACSPTTCRPARRSCSRPAASRACPSGGCGPTTRSWSCAARTSS